MPLETGILNLEISCVSSMTTGGGQGSGKWDWKTDHGLKSLFRVVIGYHQKRHTEQMGKPRVGGCLGNGHQSCWLAQAQDMWEEQAG